MTTEKQTHAEVLRQLAEQASKNDTFMEYEALLLREAAAHLERVEARLAELMAAAGSCDVEMAIISRIDDLEEMECGPADFVKLQAFLALVQPTEAAK